MWSETFSHKVFSYSDYVRHRAMKRDARTVASWDFERVIPCHGVGHSFCQSFVASPLFPGRYRRKGEGCLDECLQILLSRLVSELLFFLLMKQLNCVLSGISIRFSSPSLENKDFLSLSLSLNSKCKKGSLSHRKFIFVTYFGCHNTHPRGW